MEKTSEKRRKLKSVSNVYAKKFETLKLDGIWLSVLGLIEAAGCWLIYGKDKNGKTRLALLLAKYLAKNNRVVYISAEEGLSKNFKEIMQWAGIDPQDKKIQFDEYVPIEELKEVLNSRYAPKIIFIDNVTFYQDELKYGGVTDLIKEFPKKIFIFLAHEDRGEPYTATAKMINKLATAIMHVAGLATTVSGRVPGGNIAIDQEKAKLYHGNNIINQ